MRTTNRVERARLLLMSTQYKVELGAAIKRRRLELGLTQKGLAELTHHQESQTVSRWERGENLPSDLEVVATALQWTLPEMMAGIVPPDRRAARKLGIAEPPDGTPDPFAARDESQLDRIEQKLDQIIEILGQRETTSTAAIQQAFEDYASRLGERIGKRPARSRRATDRPAADNPAAA